MQDRELSNQRKSAEDKFNRFNDAYVKYLLATEEHKNFLIDLLNAALDEAKPSCVQGQVTEVTLMDRELSTSHEDEKYGRLDICAKTDQGQIVDIEVQSYTDVELRERNVFYFTRLYPAQKLKGHGYKDLKPVVIINLLAANYFPKFKGYVRLASFYFRDTVVGSLDFDADNAGEAYCDKATFIFVEAPKCTKLGDRNLSRLTRWMTYLSNSSSSEDEVQQLAKEDKLMSEVLEAERVVREQILAELTGPAELVQEAELTGPAEPEAALVRIQAAEPEQAEMEQAAEVVQTQAAEPEQATEAV